MDRQTPQETFFEKRRQLVLQERQKNRQSVFQRTRKLFKDIENPAQSQESNSQSQESQSLPIEEQIQLQLQGIGMVDEKTEITHQQTPTKKKSKRKSPCGSYAEMMQVPDWLIEIPENFDKFLVAALPAFKKCIVFFQSKNVVIRDKLGKLIAKFTLNSKNYRKTVLECYFDQGTKTIFVSDVISWKGNFMTDNPFNFRLAWIISNFNPKNLSQDYHFKILPYFQNNLQNLQQVYQKDLGYSKQGLIFFHQQAFYQHGLNTNMLLWKDPNISQSLKNDPQYLKQKDICGLGRLAKNGNVYSLDKVKIGAIPQSMTRKNKGFVRFSFQQLKIAEMMDQTLNVSVNQIEVLKLQGYYLKYADPVSKLVFGYMLKHKPLQIKDIASFFKK